MNNIIQIHYPGLQDLQAAEGEELTRQCRGAVRCTFYLFNLSGIPFRGWKDIEQKFGVALDHHQKIVEIMGDAARQASHSLHLLRLAKLPLEQMPFADVLGYHKTDTLPRIIQLVTNNLNLDNFSVLLPVLRIAVKTPCTAPLLEFFEVSLLFFFGANVKDGHAAEFLVGISVLLNGRIVHFKEAQCFRIQHPSGKRIVAEEQTEHFFIPAKSFFGAPPLDRQSDVASNGAQKLQISHVVSIFVFVVLNYEHSDRGRGGLERNAQPCGRR